MPPSPSWGDAANAPEVASAPPGGQAGVDHPLWDDARDTYIQWDPELASWVQWDDTAKEWHPIV
jgi:hypothetical protein